MPHCCVFGCNRKGGHKFPKDRKKNKLWIHAVRRKNWKPTKTSIVCQAHFVPSDFLNESFYSGVLLTRRKLKPDAVPTVFSWTNKKDEQPNPRTERLKNRTQHPPTASEEDHVDQGGQEYQVDLTDVSEEIIENEDSSTPASTCEILTCDVGTQTVAERARFTASEFANKPRSIHFYTGLENYSKFCFVLQTLGPAAYCLTYHKSKVLGVSVEDQFFLTLIKLRLNKQVFELSVMFDISESTVSNIFNTWVPFMALQWGELDVWPTQDLVQYFMPNDFKRKFAKTRVIIDGTEVPIAKPRDPKAQQATFSTYKNRNTLKVLVGVTPGGLISYCSDAYGGSASDRQIVERSRFMNMCAPGDNIMADRGFNVQDLFAAKDVKINMPAFLKGKSQLPGLTVVHDRKIASKRVHVERIIGMTKTYKILKHELNTNFVHLGTQLYFVCAALCNFREGIVGREA